MFQLSTFYFTGCGPEDVTVVSGDSVYSYFHVENLLTHQEMEIRQKPNCGPSFGNICTYNGKANYWIGNSHKTSSFILDLSSSQTFDVVQIVNARHMYGNVASGGTKRFK